MVPVRTKGDAREGDPRVGSRESGVGSGAANSDAGEEIVSVIEANLDDMSPQLYGYLVERALAAGALDVTCSSIQMKKNRPGLEVSILCPPERSEALAQLLFDETTTIGLRIYEARRKVLDRELVTVETRYGAVRVKVARRDGRVVNVAPEYEDCRRIASEPLLELSNRRRRTADEAHARPAEQRAHAAHVPERDPSHERPRGAVEEDALPARRQRVLGFPRPPDIRRQRPGCR